MIPRHWRMVRTVTTSRSFKTREGWRQFALVDFVDIETGELHRGILIRIK